MFKLSKYFIEILLLLTIALCQVEDNNYIPYPYCGKKSHPADLNNSVIKKRMITEEKYLRPSINKDIQYGEYV